MVDGRWSMVAGTQAVHRKLNQVHDHTRVHEERTMHWRPSTIAHRTSHRDMPSTMAPRFMLQLMQMMFVLVRNLFADRADLAVENLALRQQLAVLKRNRPRPRLDDMDRLA